MLRRIGSWTLIVVGGLAVALFVATFATTDDKSDWPGFVVLIGIALAVIALGVHWRRGPRRKGPKAEPPSERFTDAYRQLQAGAHGLAISRDATRLFVSDRLRGKLSVIDIATRTVTATWTIGGSPDMGGVSADGTQLWLSGRYDAAVYVIDTRTGQVLHRIPVGKGPHGLCVFPQPGRYSLGHTGVFR